MKNRYRCACGYERELHIGGGLNANREESVRRVFDDAELAPFDAAKQHAQLTRFFWDRAPAVCPACRELVATPLLRYWVDNRENTIQKGCPTCGGELAAQGYKAVSCPKCGERMEATSLGDWD